VLGLLYVDNKHCSNVMCEYDLLCNTVVA